MGLGMKDIKMSDMLTLPVKRHNGGVMPSLKDGKDEVIFVGERYNIDLCVTAINTYDANQERSKELEAELESMAHAAKELHGAIAEYQSMPCTSLMDRMVGTARRYNNRIFNPKIWVGKQK